MREIENTIFENAIREFKNNINLPITVIEFDNEYDSNNMYDKKVKIEIQDIELIFNVEIKKTVTNTVIGHIKLQNTNIQYPKLLITNYITKEMADNLKGKEIQFIDTAGNAYLNQFPLYLFIKGNKPKDYYKIPKQKRIFKSTGIKLLYNIITNPNLLNKTYREIANETGVALGTINWIMKDMRDLGFLVDLENKGKKITDFNEMIDKWCINYPEKLKPKIHLGNFEFINKNINWNNFQLNNALWGGEAAAAKLTNYLKPVIFTVYLKKEDLNKIVIDNRLKRKNIGNIQFYEKFWLNDPITENNTVHPLLVYADLLATGNDRNIETAKIIYDQYIKYF